ncbi:sigma-70 family RNA polymerase sigma factor [Meiothermus granaticius]|uniref:ECF RNA polymerase sigma factor SigK n=1 Tax=Meiothermus granaticius NBRC 107808 TaxID=1227551 RepID=A0A399F559_9DEIN|nr:sigma-70 family RNA polymerase sigma factor [Meiothermus granaticius]MCL6527496.1 sigma-70 family RNA polymerase sigma factor [Thermaceae bacterium]RIH91203.1 ECF RNA polymerase sigma factor SigK [Meiothermus granaticius NBRC 107808]GEM85800.1 putative RNA polymerase sigma E protein [Meiothermus granaticius NBRC 107808]
MSLEAFSDESLLALVARGDEEALRVLFRRYAKAVLALAKRMGLDAATREDCVQEVFGRIWKGAETFDPRRTSARSWLLAVAHHGAVDLVRRQAARPQALEPDPEHEEEAFDLAGPGLDEGAALDRIRLERGLRALSFEERQVIEVLYYQGYAHQEAAARLGLPLGTLKTRARRALEKLREVLGEA